MLVKAIVAFTFISLVSSSAVPITKCKLDDTKCFKQNSKVLIPLFAAGIPELGIEPMDPLHFDKVDASNDLLKLVFTDFKFTGLRTCKFKKIEHDKVKQLLSFKMHCDIALDGQYKMDGTILILTVTGEGHAHSEHEKFEINFQISYKEENGTDGKKHWIMGASTHDFKYLGKNVVQFDNLGGNDLLAQATKTLMKESPKELSEYLAPPVVNVVFAKIQKNIKIFFEKIPVEEFALE